MRKIEPKSGPVPGRKAPLVLYVEDNDDNWTVADMRLSRSYRVVRACNDREACEALKRHGADLYVILMDIELQGSKLDGTDLARLVRGLPLEKPLPEFAREVPVLKVPIIFVTAYHTQLTPQLRQAGGDLVIPKPVEFMRLMRELTAMHLKSIGA